MTTLAVADVWHSGDRATLRHKSKKDCWALAGDLDPNFSQQARDVQELKCRPHL
jgi:hypothetical protein